MPCDVMCKMFGSFFLLFFVCVVNSVSGAPLSFHFSPIVINRKYFLPACWHTVDAVWMGSYEHATLAYGTWNIAAYISLYQPNYWRISIVLGEGDAIAVQPTCSVQTRFYSASHFEHNLWENFVFSSRLNYTRALQLDGIVVNDFSRCLSCCSCCGFCVFFFRWCCC